MSILLKSLIDNSDLFDRFVSEFCQRCISCGVVIQTNITGINKSPKGMVCDDCYYQEWGEEIEKHPVGHPHIHRG